MLFSFRNLKLGKILPGFDILKCFQHFACLFGVILMKRCQLKHAS